MAALIAELKASLVSFLRYLWSLLALNYKIIHII